MSEAPVVRLELPARPEGVGVVRQALVGVADGLALDGAVLSDAKMAVTEACTNAVVHAHDDHRGRRGGGGPRGGAPTRSCTPRRTSAAASTSRCSPTPTP